MKSPLNVEDKKEDASFFFRLQFARNRCVRERKKNDDDDDADCSALLVGARVQRFSKKTFFLFALIN